MAFTLRNTRRTLYRATASVNALALRQDSIGHIWGAGSSGELYLWSLESYRNSAKSLRSETVWIPPLRTEKLAYRLWRAERGGPSLGGFGAPPHEASSLRPYSHGAHRHLGHRRGLAPDFPRHGGSGLYPTPPRSCQRPLPSSGSGAIYALNPLTLSIKRTLHGHQAA